MIYVGPWERRPTHVVRAAFLDRLHPRQMAAALLERIADGDYWVNIPHALDGIDAGLILVLTPSGLKPLSSHYNYDPALDAGQFWSRVGEDW
jgi:hypothetical protein